MERNLSLDYFKIILSILIVSIHIPINGTHDILWWLISEGIARIGVPCFFIINGYFCNLVINDIRKLKKYILKLSILYVVWSFVYTPFFIMSSKHQIFTTLMNGHIHLWYLLGLIGSILLIYLTKSYSKKKILVLAIICFSIGFIYQRLTLLNIHVYDPNFIGFRILFIGFPFSFIGYLLKTTSIHISRRKILTLIVFFLFFLLGESLVTFYLTKLHYLNYKVEIYLSLIVLCPILVYGIDQFYKKNERIDNSLSKIASGVYFIHVFVISVCSELFVNFIYIQKYPIVLITSFIFAAGLVFLNRSIKIFL